MPLAHADDLKDKKHKVEQRVKARQGRPRGVRAGRVQGHRALHTRPGPAAPGPRDAGRRPGQAGRRRGARQADAGRAGQAAVALSQARDDLRAGREQGRGPAAAARPDGLQNIPAGDPSLMGLSMVLTSQDPAELTRQLNTVGNLMDKETDRPRPAQSRAHPAHREGAKVEDAKAEVEPEAQGRRREPRAPPGARGEGGRGGGRRHRAGRATRRTAAGRRRCGPGTPTSAPLRQTKQRGDGGSSADARRAPRSTTASTRATTGSLMRPVPGYGHLAVRLAPAPDLRLLGSARRHRLRRPLRHPDPGRRLGRGDLGVLPDRLGQPARSSTSVGCNGHGLATIYNHLSGYRVHTGERVAAARSSGTPAPPAGPPAATCTSPCCSTAAAEPDELVLRSRPDTTVAVVCTHFPTACSAREVAGYHGTVVSARCPRLREWPHGQGRRAQARRAEPQGAPRLPHRRHLRGRAWCSSAPR